MKNILVVLMLVVAQLVAAQDFVVYNVTGSAEKQNGSAWSTLNKREPLKGTDLVKVGKNSVLSVIDKKNNKIYAFKESQPKSVSALVQQVSGNEKALTTKFATYAAKSLFDGSSSTITHDAAACAYRGASVENDIARTLLFKEQNTSLVQINNAQTDYGVSFELVDRQSESPLSGSASIGKEAFFRIKNSSNKDLYVNIMDVNAQGELYDCLPVDNAMTLSHLLIPAESIVDLKDYPIAFSAPQGTDHLILVAYDEPFDIREVNKVLLKQGVQPLKSAVIGVYTIPVQIW